MKSLTKEQALKITEITSSIYQQGNTWVFSELDLNTGVTRLSRGLTEKAARKKLKTWRREKMEELLRSDTSAKAFTLRKWHENPSWNGAGIWQWAQNFWYTTREEAEQALEKRIKSSQEEICEIFETTVAQIPGHFIVA